MGYLMDDIDTVAALLANGDGDSLKDLINIDSSLIDDILAYLTEKVTLPWKTLPPLRKSSLKISIKKRRHAFKMRGAFFMGKEKLKGLKGLLILLLA